MAYRQTNALFSGYGFSYPSPFIPGYAHQQGQYPGSPDLLAQLPEDGFVNPNFRPMRGTASAAYRSHIQRRSVGTPLPASVPRLPAREQPLILSPSTPRDTPLDKFLKTSSQDQSETSIIQASGNMTAVDKLVAPSAMPIGSVVHLQQSQKWGVVKVANIPYSITKQEIVQFLGRQARLISTCPIHIIMERSTAKTMDCYAEFETVKDAQETVTRINKIAETGRPPRLGNRVVYVELSSQNELLKDLFPRAKCVSWQEGMPIALPNRDPYSTGFSGFFTGEEILGAIRHAEIPHRSPFCAKCPQRTYESTISTLYKFPWYATTLYTVHDRNTLFEMANRHIKSLVFRLKITKTIGLDQRLLRELLYAGLNCPTFNERQKFTLCVNSEDISEILKFPGMGKWFPFDALVRMPNTDENTLLFYANLISKGTLYDQGSPELPNTFPMDNFELESPYGRNWFEWPLETAKHMLWEEAVQCEMVNLCNLVLTGWINQDKGSTLGIEHLSIGSTPASSSQINNPRATTITVSPFDTEDNSQVLEEETPPSSSSKVEIYATPRRARNQHSYSGTFSRTRLGSIGENWSQELALRPSAVDRTTRPKFLGHHRNTLSSPCFSSNFSNQNR